MLSFTALTACSASAERTTPTNAGDGKRQTSKAISPDLFGIFFEDLNWAADGGLYAELIQNRSFEYSNRDHKDWNSLTAWELIRRDDGKSSVTIESSAPLHKNNPHYAVLNADGAGAGLRNSGFDGIPVKHAEKYDISLFARVLSGNPGPILARLESASGDVLGEATLPRLSSQWHKLDATITAKASETHARLSITVSGAGSVCLDVVSLFPRKAFRNRPNGLRPDLARAIADLKPKFVRFPGGCLAHGDGLDNMYRWKDTIGPVEQRREQPNIWRYHQSVGLGYFEYFQFCEDIGATPLPIVPAGVCCQNSGANITGKYGIGQAGLPMDQMPEYVQEVLDLIEWANGPAHSTWGAKRAAAGHPKPFKLRYLGIGNEDAQTDVFRERFKMIHDAVKARHPEITLIGTVGPDPDGADYDAGWKFANEQHIAMVDEHGYKPPHWFFENLTRFDAYDRDQSKVYLGEYAAFDSGRINTLMSALAEAAYMTSLERNGDLVRLASYAPLLAREGHTQWTPDMIYFTGTDVLRTANYYVQQMFSCNQGDIYLPDAVTASPSPGGNAPSMFASSCVMDSGTGDVVVKIVNASSAAVHAQVHIPVTDNIRKPVVSRVDSGKTNASCTVLTGDPQSFNTFANPDRVMPMTTAYTAADSFVYDAPPYSLTVIRMKTQAGTVPPTGD